MINSTKTKNIIILLIVILINCNVQSQVFDGNIASKSLKWTLEQKDFDALPRVNVSPMSIKLWDNYNGSNAPSAFGTLLEIYGRDGHQTSQLYFGGWDSSRIRYREAFYAQNTWSSWITMLDSKNDVESSGNLKITGSANNYILNGNVGIGTTSPTSTLDVNGIITATAPGNPIIRFVSTHITSANRNWDILSNLNEFGNFDIRYSSSTNVYPTISALTIKGANGNVGIGTINPEAKLDVNGSVQSNGGANQLYGFGQSSSSKPIDVRQGSHYPYVFNWHEGLTFSAHSAYGGIRFYNQGYPDMYGTGVLVMSITNNNVGIGTTSPDSKLTVKGKIHTEEVKVDLAVPADYVFEKYYLGESSLKPDYTLLTLSEVEKFTAANHHLPNVPSAKEIKENGLLLGEMSNILLQKIEELTLYSIEQQKTIEKLEKENESFKTLSERFSKIENQLKNQN